MSKVYDIVTERIINELEKGIVPWKKSWRGEKAINYITRKPYHGINTLLLPYPGEYLTFKQVQEKGGKVKKGEKACMVTFFKMLETEETETENAKQIPVLRYYNVFHISQTEGIESKCEPFKAENEVDIIEKAETIINEYVARENLKLTIIMGSDRAYYAPANDEVVLPNIGQFNNSNEYYSTAFHELIHSTGHSKRLDRHSEQKSFNFGSKDYSKEELVAEIGAAMINNEIGIEQQETFENNVAYIASWLKVLKNDSKFIVSAAGKAQKAADYILQ